MSVASNIDPQTAEAYLFCRNVARREAKNFYWAFRVLPRHKSDAMCAVYAFMRRADDLSDDESKSIEDRRVEMAAWLNSWRASRASAAKDYSTRSTEDELFQNGCRPEMNCHSEQSEESLHFARFTTVCTITENTLDPVFRALAHTQKAFNIPDALLEELVAGTTMDLEPRATSGEIAPGQLDPAQTYATFDDLYRYCYLVASVVGLVCIKIFGYTDPRAEKFAEETGVAFQLTNILRDVKEDIERDRVYLPLDLLDEFGESPAELRTLAAGRAMTERERAMLATLAIRAEKYYLAANKLTPLLDRDSRAAMWVLVTIYHRLLARIADHKMEVFRTRVALSTTEKLSVMARGAVMAAWNRVFA
jgi:phytoene synthase